VVSGQQHAPATLNPGENPIPTLQEARWAPGLVWSCGKSRPLRDLIPDLQPVAQSLYRLSYRAHDAVMQYSLFNGDMRRVSKRLVTKNEDKW